MNELDSAELASQKTLDEMFVAINAAKCFRVEAGAGAGKTYSLVKALQYLIEYRSYTLNKCSQQIACITYTNVAKDEIKERTDNHPTIYTETIHGFCWSLLSGLQKELRGLIPKLSDKWKERIEAIGGIQMQRINYDLGYPSASEREITLHHDDVIKLMVKLLDVPKFHSLIKCRFPIIFIDEYQDTNIELAESIKRNLIEMDSGILVGLFGDHWQRIYGSKACGLMECSSDKLVVIGKNVNFRSYSSIVDALNRMRPELVQQPKKIESVGYVNVFHSNGWQGKRRTENHWQKDLPAVNAHKYLEATRLILENDGWDFDPKQTKILMLTNNVLADEQDYRNLANCFKENDDYLKPNDHYIKFFLETIEPICEYFENKQYGAMFKHLDKQAPKLARQSDKKIWARDIERLCQSRKNMTIAQVLELLKETNHPRLSPKVEEGEKHFAEYPSLPSEAKTDKIEKFYEKIRNLRGVKYSEMVNLKKYTDNLSPYSTKHGVKGAEFENVLVVCGRGWNQYDWNQMLELWGCTIPMGKMDFFERNQNLFYVACSRPKRRLALLFTQELSTKAMNTLEFLFAKENVYGNPN
jgi:DNA helicase II / ATP-dependent DNA helicase PcrA